MTGCTVVLKVGRELSIVSVPMTIGTFSEGQKKRCREIRLALDAVTLLALHGSVLSDKLIPRLPVVEWLLQREMPSFGTMTRATPGVAERGDMR